MTILDQHKSVQKSRTMTRREQLFFYAVGGVGIAAIVRYALWWFSLSHVAFKNATATSASVFFFILLSFVVWHGLLQRLGAWFIMLHMHKPDHFPPQAGLKVAMLTCFVPGKEPYDLLEVSLKAMTQVRYPHDTWVLDEGDDAVVKALCVRLGVHHFSRKGIERYNQAEGTFKAKTKAGNHNAWRDAHESEYDFVAQMDMDHVPYSFYLDRILGYFRDPKVAFVVGPQIYGNLDNWIARGSAEQAYIFHGPFQQGFFGQDMPLFIGTNHAYRPQALQTVGGYASTIVEDHLTGMYFFANGWKGVYVPEVIAVGEGPSNWEEYLSQQMRWAYGIFEVLVYYSPKLLRKMSWSKRINFLAAQTYYLTGVASVISIFLTCVYLIFGYASADFNIYEWLSHSAPPFIISLFLQQWAQRFYLDPEAESGWGLRGMLLAVGALPIYAWAFYKVLTRQKLQYVVTAKGSSVDAATVPVQVFYPHLLIIGVSLLSLALSFVTGHTAIQLRWWALFTIIIYSLVVLSSRNLAQDLGWRPRFTLSPKLSFKPVLIATLLLVNVVVFDLVVENWHSSFNPLAALMQNVALKSEQITPQVEAAPAKVSSSETRVYLGLSGDHMAQRQLAIEAATTRKFFLVGRYQAWGDTYKTFDGAWATSIQQRGSVPYITWEPWATASSVDRVDQPEYKLSTIINGQHDAYIRAYAQDIARFGHPVMLRFAHEMNGNWYPWSAVVNSNSAQDYVLAWRHVHDLFEKVGARNVTWVWAPNEPYHDPTNPYSSSTDALYPGDDYVDWVGFSGFNWGKTNPTTSWRTFRTIVMSAYAQLSAYNKPLMIAEMNTASTGGSRTLWMAQMNANLASFPKIRAVVWFESDDAPMYKLDLSATGYTAF